MSIKAISPIDGRYKSKTIELSDFFSEKALISYRIKTECYYLIQLLKTNVSPRKLTSNEETLLKNLHKISDEDGEIVKAIETKGYLDYPATNHDVKAIEYFIKIKLKDTSLNDVLEMVHFALTSEDINNISYALMLKDGINQAIIPVIAEVYNNLYKLALEYKDLPMLSRTHGQPASPTTFGKEILIFTARMKEELTLLNKIEILSKLNGATGNYNAHNVVFPNNDWVKFTDDLITTFNVETPSINIDNFKNFLIKLRVNPVTPQIEPHDSYSRIFDSFKRINTILIDFSQDIWRYISDGWIKQKAVKGEIGSSAMPHKVNPIDFENGEGNFGVANALFAFFSSKLQISRLQRDLSDSTTLRNIGVAFAHSIIGYKSLLKGLSKISVDGDKIREVLINTPEVIAEAYQNILRVSNVEKPYELLKEVSRGKKTELEDYHNLAKKIDVSDDIKAKLLAITSDNYLGIASKIVDNFTPEV